MNIGTKIKNIIIRKLGGIPFGERIVVNEVTKRQHPEAVECTAEFRTRIEFPKSNDDEKTEFERWIKRNLIDVIAKCILENDLMSINYLQSEENIILNETVVRGVVKIIPPEKEE